MRLFIAIELSAQIKNSLCSAQGFLKKKGVTGNYTPRENMHLTLAFIGECPDEQQVIDALEGISFSPFELRLRGFGCFGDIWWAGVSDPAPLCALAKKLRFRLESAGIPYDKKKFSPHMTLVRKASGDPSGIIIPSQSMRVGSFTLMRSDFGKGAMIYTPLAEFFAS